jgi:hypothetical protein
MKQVIFFLIAIIFTVCTQAQSAVGKWKLTTVYTEDEKGKKTDMLGSYKSCEADAVLIFTAGGKIGSAGAKCPGAESGEVIGVKWKLEKNKLKIWMDEADDDPTTYDVKFNGNKMIWTINYTDVKGIRLLLYEFTRA